MAQSICSASPEGEEPQNATGGEDDCPACRGHGRKLVMLSGPADTAGGSPEDDVLKRTRTDCLKCSGSGRVPP